jgi:hypothetical protein
MGWRDSVEQLDKENPELKHAITKFLDHLVSATICHYMFDDGILVLAHAA